MSLVATPRAAAVPAPTSSAPGGAVPLRTLVEFLLVGGATLLLLPVFHGLQWWLGIGSAELAVGFLTFHGALIINDPHFAASYLLFYRDARGRAFGRIFGAGQRVRYWIAGFVVPVALVVWASVALGSNSPRVLGWMIQLMFLLVGWHYVKQAFGVLVVLSARRGVQFRRSERALVLLHCYSGWAYARASPWDPGTDSMEKGVLYHSTPHPAWLETATLAVFALSTLALCVVGAQRIARKERIPLVPLFGFLITVWLWVVFSSVDLYMAYLIPAFHSVQYLYFVWLLERNRLAEVASSDEFRSLRSRLLRFGLSALALGWLLFHGVPTFLDETVGRGYDTRGGLGPTPYFAALFAIVNIHHYFMDFVIWRRENPDSRYLGQQLGSPIRVASNDTKRTQHISPFEQAFRSHPSPEGGAQKSRNAFAGCRTSRARRVNHDRRRHD